MNKAEADSVTVLVIDTDDRVRESIGSFLNQLDYKVVQAASAREGVERFHSAAPRLVLCALDMPYGGLDCLCDIHGVAPDVPIIVLAPLAARQELVEAMRLGISDYLIKPLDNLEMLQLSIANCLRRTRLIAENNSYRHSLESINRELEQRVEIFRNDQQAGRHVQMSTLPESPEEICGFRFRHCIIPSLYLSGDSVDYKPIAKDRAMFWLADVSGHGSSSAFVAMLLRFRIEQLRREHIRGRYGLPFTPARILESLNRDLLDSGLDKYITLFMGILDHERRELSYSVAGHYPLPILLNGGEAEYLAIREHSFPIGLTTEACYKEEELPLTEGFRLLLFSDGILETLNEGDEGAGKGKAKESKGTESKGKEEQLLAEARAAGGDFDALIESLGLNDKSNVPDDITVMSVAGL